MILSDRDIKQYLRDGRIVIDPLPEDRQYSTTAVDLLLGDEVLRWLPAQAGVTTVVQPDQVGLQALYQQYTCRAQTEADGSFILEPGEFVVCVTHERVSLPRDSKIAARVEGRSKLARLGLSIHLSAPTIHSGFTGKITLEMRNSGPLRLKLPKRLAVCQLVFEKVTSTPGAHTSSFSGQSSPSGRN
jgi:dCTP deaminase